MGKKKAIMTNAMRILNAAKVKFNAIEYETDGTISDHFGIEIAQKTGINPNQSFKTLVAKGEKQGIMVACIPVNQQIDLKKFASSVGDKRVELIPVKDLLGLTGYIRGGVSPIGMKKQYPTYIEASCMDFDTIAISAGVCGCTLILSPDDLVKILNAKLFANS